MPERFEHYAPWKTIEGREVVSDRPGLEVLIKGVFEPKRFLDLLRNFIVFSDETVTDKVTGQLTRVLVKRVAKYHQYWAVNAAVESTVQASQPDGDRRGGVVWHTQGSGKSFEMVFYAAKIMRDPRMVNPTLVFITDRNDLDDQLFGETFAPARILPETPVQAATRTDLREKLKRASGGIIFTTLQKFAPGEDGDANPVLTDRRNVVVVADEGTPQPIRLRRISRPTRPHEGRSRQTHARCIAWRDLSRLHRDSDRIDRQEHSLGIWGLR